MSRPKRVDVGGLFYHVLNRSVNRQTLFHTWRDYEQFERTLTEAIRRMSMRVLSYAVMPNHFHLVLWPRCDGDLSKFMHWLTETHAHRWRGRHGSRGWGHVYQDRYKSFIIEDEHYLYTVCRYTERNAQRANLVARAEQWRYSSLWRRHRGSLRERELLEPWSLLERAEWIEHVNQPLTEAELAAIRLSVQRGVPYGSTAWVEEQIARFGLESTVRPRGRPRKSSASR